MLELKLGTGDVIDQGDITSWPTEEIDALRQARQLLIGGRIRHLQMIQTTLRQTGESGLGQIAHVEIRVQPEAEGHRLIAAVVNRGADLEGHGHRPHLHVHHKGKGIGRKGVVGAAQAEAHAALVIQQLQLPGEIAGKTMLLEGVINTIHLKQIAGKIAADREQNWNAPANAFGRVGVTLLVEIEHLTLTTAPFTDDAAPFGNDPQTIAGLGMDILPMGIGSGLLGEGHGHPLGRAESGLLS